MSKKNRKETCADLGVADTRIAVFDLGWVSFLQTAVLFEIKEHEYYTRFIVTLI